MGSFSTPFFKLYKRSPAFFPGLFFFLGTLFLFKTAWAFFPAAIIYAICKKKKLGFLFFLPSLLFPFFYHFPKNSIYGDALIKVYSHSEAKRHGFIYTGSLLSLNSQTLHLPCTLYSKTLYPSGFIYQLEGTLKQKKHGYSFYPDRSWKPFKAFFSLEQKRKEIKEKVNGFLKEKMETPCALFLGGLLTGNLPSPLMKADFSRYGLAHLLAISGFHFSFFALFLAFFCRPFFSYKVASVILLFFLTAYFFFIGQAPSVGRAFIACLLVLVGNLLALRPNGLNSLGVGVFFVFLCDPLSLLSLSFQLSFLATLAIFLLYSPCKEILTLLIPHFSFIELKKHSAFFQICYLFSSIFRNALSLSLAVHVALYPVILMFFHEFPLHSLIYNLFFPFLCGMVFFLLLSALLFYCISSCLGDYLLVLTNACTSLLLRIFDTPPYPLIFLRKQHLSAGFTTLYLTLLFLLSLYLKQKMEERGKRILLESYF